jgi:predicted short-subunit dehydrogenase-like oxidoreductase (DUF2520 family)
MPKPARRKSALKIPSTFILGAGKVGDALARAIRKAGGKATLRPARKGLPKKQIEADLLIIAVRDRDILPLATALEARGLVAKRTACVHVAGALDAEALAPLRAACAGVAQMHPMISFASRAHPPRLEGGHVHVKGDAVAVKRAKQLVSSLGMTPRTFAKLDPIGYHAAAGLVANGAAALAALGAKILAEAGVDPATAPLMLGPLLHSVADNVSALGFPQALTGPVRRGDPAAIAKHLAILEERVPEALPVFIAAGLAQVPLAREIGEAPPHGFDAIEKILKDAEKTHR